VYNKNTEKIKTSLLLLQEKSKKRKGRMGRGNILRRWKKPFSRMLPWMFGKGNSGMGLSFSTRTKCSAQPQQAAG